MLIWLQSSKSFRRLVDNSYLKCRQCLMPLRPSGMFFFSFSRPQAHVFSRTLISYHWSHYSWKTPLHTINSNLFKASRFVCSSGTLNLSLSSLFPMEHKSTATIPRRQSLPFLRLSSRKSHFQPKAPICEAHWIGRTYSRDTQVLSTCSPSGIYRWGSQGREEVRNASLVGVCMRTDRVARVLAYNIVPRQCTRCRWK